jgi:nucleotide-binding universal stress UspA family protein
MKRFKNILFVAGPDDEDAPALHRAAALAQENQALLTVTSVVDALPGGTLVPDSSLTGEGLQSALVAEAQQRLDRLVTPLRDGVQIRTQVLAGTLFLEVVRDVLRNGRDLVVKPIADRGPWAWLLTGEDMHLLRKCPCPVWLQKRDDPARYRCILAAVDPGDEDLAGGAAQSALNAQILELAVSLALAEFAELHLVHVWSAIGEGVMRGTFLSTPEEQVRAYVSAEGARHAMALNSLIEEVTRRLGPETMDYVKPVKHLVKGAPRDEIPALARQLGADLAVLGTVARGGIPGLLMGNTAETLLHRLDCSMLAVKPPGFVSPIVP